jgi:hypothetical protein
LGGDDERVNTWRRWRWGRCFEVPLGELDHGDTRHLVGVEGTEISTLSFAGVEKDFLCRREREREPGQGSSVGERAGMTGGRKFPRQFAVTKYIDFLST